MFTPRGKVFIIPIKKNTRQASEDSKRFWERESEALLTPRKSIDDVRFISIPEDIIPRDDLRNENEGNSQDLVTPIIQSVEYDEDEEENESEATARERVSSISAELRGLSKKKIADLSEYTNTDLRIKYGSPNFTKLSTADSNYIRLVQVLPILISSLMVLSRTEEARKLLDFCDENDISTARIKALRSELGKEV